LVARRPESVRGGPAVARPFAHLAVDLGGEDDALAPAAALGEPAAHDLLRDALAGLPSVDVRGIEEVDAGIERPVHEREAVRLARLRAEVHRAEAEAAHAQASSTEADV